MSAARSAVYIPGAKSIQRVRTGCKTCKRRGKKCDEVKPTCKACVRLELNCSYNNGVILYKSTADNKQTKFGPAREALLESRTGTDRILAVTNSSQTALTLSGIANQQVASGIFHSTPHLNNHVSIASRQNDLIYFKHFDRQVWHSLPPTIQSLSPLITTSSSLRYAILCVSASSLSNLDRSGGVRHLVTSASKPDHNLGVNKTHLNQAQNYHNLAQQYCSIEERDKSSADVSAILIAKVLLAFYHDSTTDHLQFRLALWESVRFVLENQSDILASPTGNAALQLWYRLCMSHRPSKPPALPIEGEAIGSFSPNLTVPGTNDHLYMRCLTGMSTDDLIYDILIRTIEIRTREVVYHCTSKVHNIPECSPSLGSLVHRVFNKMMNRPHLKNEEAEAQTSFAQGDHLLGLLEIQKKRLQLWRSMLTSEQLPRKTERNNNTYNTSDESFGEGLGTDLAQSSAFSTNRNAMNYLYYNLCNIIFHDIRFLHLTPSHEISESRTDPVMVQEMFDIIDQLDLSQSHLFDVYTFSLTEVLLELSYAFQSTSAFKYVLNNIWPKIDALGRGFENSHMPTHLAKRVIALIAKAWHKGQRILLCIPAIAEDIPKSLLFNPDHEVEIAIYGYQQNTSFFIEKIPLSKA